MNTAVQAIGWQGLVLAFVPSLIVFGIMFRWAAGAKTAIYATLRMLLQLLLIGYVLVYVFSADQPGIIVGVLAVMLFAASWIAIRPVQNKQPRVYLDALIAISVAGLFTLAAPGWAQTYDNHSSAVSSDTSYSFPRVVEGPA